MDEVSKNLADTHSVNIPGAALLWLLDAVMHRAKDSLLSHSLAKAEGYDEETLMALKRSEDAAMGVGGLLLSEVARIFGDEWTHAYMSGEAPIPPPPPIDKSALN